MQKTLFIARPKTQLKKARKEKIKVYAKKLSSRSINNRKKALFRLLELDPDFLAEFSRMSGNFKLKNGKVFLAAPEQFDSLHNHLTYSDDDRFHVLKGNHSNFLHYDELGMIQSQVRVISLDTWKDIEESQDYLKLPDPKENIFWKEIRPRYPAGLKNEAESPVLGKGDEMKRSRNQRKRIKNFSLIGLKVEKNQNPLNGSKRFRIKSQSRKRNHPISRKRSRRISRPNSKVQNERALFQVKQLNNFCSILDEMNLRTEGKIDQINSLNLFTPTTEKMRPFNKTINNMRSFGDSSFSPKWIQKKKERGFSRDNFSDSVMKFMRKREEDKKRERAWSLKVRFRKYGNGERISVF